MYRSTGDSSLILSVIVPVYNEATTIRGVLMRIVQATFTKEIIVVDDGSTDGTAEILEDVDTLKAALTKALPAATFDLKIFFHHRNQGKGAAIRTAVGAVTGDVVLIQDADLEYDPAEYPKLLQPIQEGKASGLRFAFSWRSPPRSLLLACPRE